MLDLTWKQEREPLGGEILFLDIPPVAVMGVNGGLMQATSVNATLADRRAPAFEASLATDEGLTWLPQGTVLLRYDELVFGSGDNGRVAISDLIVEILGNATLANVTEQKWDGSSTPPVGGGSSGARRRLSTGGSWESALTLTLLADATESVSVSLLPKPNSIFDATGNAMLSQRTVSASVVVPTAGPLLGATAAMPAASAPAAALAIGALAVASVALITAAEMLRRFSWRRKAETLREELSQLTPLVEVLDGSGGALPSKAEADFKSIVKNSIIAAHSLRAELDAVQGLGPPSETDADPPSQPLTIAHAMPARPSVIEVAHSVAPSETDRLAVEKLLVAMEAARQAPVVGDGGGVRGKNDFRTRVCCLSHILPLLRPHALELCLHSLSAVAIDGSLRTAATKPSPEASTASRGRRRRARGRVQSRRWPRHTRNRGSESRNLAAAHRCRNRRTAGLSRRCDRSVSSGVSRRPHRRPT